METKKSHRLGTSTKLAPYGFSESLLLARERHRKWSKEGVVSFSAGRLGGKTSPTQMETRPRWFKENRRFLRHGGGLAGHKIEGEERGRTSTLTNVNPT